MHATNEHLNNFKYVYSEKLVNKYMLCHGL